MSIDKNVAERAIIANRPGEPFVLVERVDGDALDDLSALEWQAPTEPPTWKDVQKWTAALILEEARAEKCAEAKAALAASDLWAIRHAEDGFSLTPERRAYRAAIRAILDQAPAAKDPGSLALPDLPPRPTPPS